MHRPGQAAPGGRVAAVVSALDFVPTILDWAGAVYPAEARAGFKPATLSGSSLLPLLPLLLPLPPLPPPPSGAPPAPAAGGAGEEGGVGVGAGVGASSSSSAAAAASAAASAAAERPAEWRGTAFATHQFHSLYAYYPMRTLRTATHRLVHNLNFNLKFAILEDVWGTDTWRAIENGTTRGGGAPGSGSWVYNYTDYMLRPEYQLFDVQADPLNLRNLAGEEGAAATLRAMVGALQKWRLETNDPWAVCEPGQGEHDSVCSF
jgi:arylsulfatase A-like enzyme